MKYVWGLGVCVGLAACDAPSAGPEVTAFDGDVVEIVFSTPSSDIGAMSEATGTAFAVARQTCGGTAQMLDTRPERQAQAQFGERVFTFQCVR